MKKLIQIILFLVALFIVVVNVFSYFSLSFFGLRIFRVGSGSMEPYLRVNDLIVVKSSDNYRVNDIITYKDNNEYITHRIVSINDNEFITKGDKNNTHDDVITKNKVVGKLVYKFHTFNFVSYLLSKQFIWILLFVIGFIITYLIPDNKNNIDEERI